MLIIKPDPPLLELTARQLSPPAPQMLLQGLPTTSTWQLQAVVSSQSSCCSTLCGISHRCPLPPSGPSPLGFQTPRPAGFLLPSPSASEAVSPPSHLYCIFLSPPSAIPVQMISSSPMAAGIHTDSCSPQVTSPDVSPELRLVYPVFCPIFLSLCTAHRRLKHHVQTEPLILSPTLTCSALQSSSSQ